MLASATSWRRQSLPDPLPHARVEERHLLKVVRRPAARELLEPRSDDVSRRDEALFDTPSLLPALSFHSSPQAQVALVQTCPFACIDRRPSFAAKAPQHAGYPNWRVA